MEKPHNFLFKADIQVKQSPIHRYGVFASRDFSPNDPIEECPVIIYEKVDMKNIEDIYDREFCWDDKSNALLLGYGSVYNHSREPNAIFIPDYENRTVNFFAKKPISKGEEIFISYGRKWFVVRNIEEKVLVYPEKKNDRIFFIVFGFIAILLVLSKIFPVG